jgi:aryl-alcohol dehydrogenase-like predicted oxidoreductase
METNTTELRALGSSRLHVTPVGLGCWQFSKGRGIAGRYWGTLPQDSVRRVVSASVAAGVNWFDTAEVYGWGESERALSDALRSCGVRAADCVVATKWFPLLRRAAHLSRSFPRRERELSPYPVSLHQVHFPASLSRVEKLMDRMAELARASRIEAIGVSNFSAEQMYRAQQALDRHGLTLASNQVRFNLLDREIEQNDVLAAARELGVAIIAYSPLAQGVLSGKYHKNRRLIQSRPGPRRKLKRFSDEGLARTQPLVDELQRLATAYSTPDQTVTAAQIALNWVLHVHGKSLFAIPGASNEGQAVQNAHAMTFRLTPAEQHGLTELADAL